MRTATMSDDMRHPIQPIYKDRHGTERFQSNAIVKYLLEHGGIDLNKLAMLEFSNEDRQQFAQLIGYSLIGYAELSYVTDDAYKAAIMAADNTEPKPQKPYG